MKKILSAVALSSLVLSATLMSCSQQAAPSYDARQDTVETLATPEVKATAYPGLNYVSWKPVSGAKSYLVSIYENGHYRRSESIASEKSLFVADTELVNDVNYTYYVEAETKDQKARALYFKNSAQGSATVKANVPDYNVKSLELNAWEKGKNSKGNEKFLLAADNINVALDNYNNITLSFPLKAYLEYSAFYSIDEQYEKTGKLNQFSFDALGSTTISDKAVNDKILPLAKVAITKAGKYTVYVQATAANKHFGVSEPVKAGNTITVPQLLGKFEKSPTVAYKDKAGKIARITFDGFTLTDGTTAPADYYVVYRSAAETPYVYTKVSGTVKAQSAANDKFFVEDEVPDTTKKYIYTLVATKDGKFAGEAKTADLTANGLDAQATGAVTISGATSTLHNNGIADDITWTITLSSAETKITGVYELLKPVTDTATVVAADFDTTTSLKYTAADDTSSKVYKVYREGLEVGKKAYLLVTTSEANKKDAQFISTAVEIKYPNVTDVTSFTAQKYDNRKNLSTKSPADTVENDVIIEVIDTINTEKDAVTNYTYTLYKAKGSYKIATDKVVFSLANDWDNGTVLTLEDNTAYSTAKSKTYVKSLKEEDNPTGTYAYKLVKTNVNSGKSVTSDIKIVAINTDPTISYKPIISAAFAVADTDDKKAEVNRIITVTFTKNNTVNNPIPVTGHETESLSQGQFSGYVSESAEADAKYTCYKATMVKDSTDIVFTKVNEFSGGKSELSAKTTTYKWDANTNNFAEDNANYQYVDKIVYTLEDTNSTANSYKFVVVVTKGNCDPYVTNIFDVAGAN